jgi:hypothetical protein
MTIVPLTLLRLSHMFKVQLQGAGVISSYRSFLSPIQRSRVCTTGFIGSLEEVVGWATGERVAMSCWTLR